MCPKEEAELPVAQQEDRAGRTHSATGRRGLRVGVLAAAFAPMAVTLVMWSLSFDPAGSRLDWLRDVSLLAGMTAFTLMAAQLVMTARVPWVERAFGHDRLIRAHMKVAICSFGLVGAHVLILRVGGGEDSGVSAPLVLAVLATFSLIVVGVTSSARVRRSLRYESWHLAHLGTYLVIAFATPHIVTAGSQTLPDWAAAYWYGLAGATFAVSLIFRVIAPLVRSRRYGLRVTEVIPQPDDAATIVMRGRHLDHWQAGQFGNWRFLDGPGWSRAHPFSLSAAPTADCLEITVKKVGDGTARVLDLRPGTRVLVEGPYGTMTLANTPPGRALLLIGAGSGIVPMKALLESPDLAGRDVIVIQRSGTADSALLKPQIEEATTRTSGAYLLLAGRRRRSDSWLPEGTFTSHDDAGPLREAVPDLDRREIFICGPNAWVTSVRSALRKAHVPRRSIHSETFTW